MSQEPQLDISWRKLTVSARGKDAIKAVRTPIFIVLTIGAIAPLACVVFVVNRPEWKSLWDVVSRWWL